MSVRRITALSLALSLVGQSPAPVLPLPVLPLPGATVPAVPAQVLPDLDPSAPVPGTTALATRIGGLLASGGLGPSVAAEVLDVQSGAVLFDRSPTRAAIPASAAKILTAAAALSLLGPDATLSTRVVVGATADEVVLVGGGDVLLAAGHGDPAAVIGRAGLADLADQVAARLAAQGRRSVAVRLDDTLFQGTATNPRWRPADVRGGYVAPVTALAVDSGNARPGRRPKAGEPFGRVSDPALAGAKLFARRLAALGVAVTGTVVRVQAPARSTPEGVLAQVRSAPVGRLVEQALTDSDNTVAEALARLVAVRSGRQATFADAGVAILDRVDLLGVPTTGETMPGGSGLGSGYAIRPRTLARVLALAASDAHPELRSLLTGLPIAGASGTLAERFGAKNARAALGAVRAKTGTLTGASSLAGTVVDADGRLLAFAVLADKVTSTTAARTALDVATSALASCGCR